MSLADFIMLVSYVPQERECNNIGEIYKNCFVHIILIYDLFLYIEQSPNVESTNSFSLSTFLGGKKLDGCRIHTAK